MRSFEQEILLTLPNKYLDKDSLIKDVAKVHGELLFIHPFREGNGRTARVLANLMCQKQGHPPLNFQAIAINKFDAYVSAIQACAERRYEKMETLIRSIFPE